MTLEYSRSGLEQTLECSWVSALEESESNGKAVTLQNAPLYYTSVDKKPVRTVSGKYYLYDGVAVAGGKTPVGKNVTGWVDAKDVRSVT